MYATKKIAKDSNVAPRAHKMSQQTPPNYIVSLHSSIVTRTVHDNASQPWSNNSPRALLVFVLRACLPSKLSNVWYPKIQNAFTKNTHDGTLVLEKSGLAQKLTTAETMIRMRPKRVITLGLFSCVNTYYTNYLRHGFWNKIHQQIIKWHQNVFTDKGIVVSGANIGFEFW